MNNVLNPYTLQLYSVFEANINNTNGLITKSSVDIVLQTNPWKSVNGMVPIVGGVNFDFTYTGTNVNGATITLKNTYWWKNNTNNPLCPNRNAITGCAKFTLEIDNYTWQNKSANALVFAWRLRDSLGVFASTMNPVGTTKMQVFNDLAYLGINNTAIHKFGQNQQVNIPVKAVLTYHAPPQLSDGIWLVYSVTTPLPITSTIVHDPDFGIINRNLFLNPNDVVIAVSVFVSILVVVLLGCSIFVYRTYYLNTRAQAYDKINN